MPYNANVEPKPDDWLAEKPLKETYWAESAEVNHDRAMGKAEANRPRRKTIVNSRPGTDETHCGCCVIAVYPESVNSVYLFRNQHNCSTLPDGGIGKTCVCLRVGGHCKTPTDMNS